MSEQEMRERVIKGLEHELQNRGKCGHYCRDGIETVSCEYDKDGLCIQHWGNDTLALLEEQEQVIEAYKDDLQETLDVMTEYAKKLKAQEQEVVNLTTKIVELTTAQEPVKPVFERRFMSDIELYDCGKCGASLGAKGIAKYCMACGQAAKWDG